MQASVSQKNIIITGVPRSGTTLVCHLLNKLPDCVALHEPLSPLELIGKNQSGLISFIFDYFYCQRNEILQNGQAISKSFGGKVPDNPLAGIDSATGKRVRVLDGRSIRIEKPLAPDFYLAIKQPAFFTAILHSLLVSQLFNCFAVVRNPLAVLLSWNTVEMPVAQGRVPAAEAFDLELSHALQSIVNLHDRQIFLLNWFFEQYLAYLPKDRILRYEHTIGTGGKSLSTISLSAQALDEHLASKNLNALYDNDLKMLLLNKLLIKSDAAFWQFYSKEEVISLATTN